MKDIGKGIAWAGFWFMIGMYFIASGVAGHLL